MFTSGDYQRMGGPIPNSIQANAIVVKDEVRAMMDQFLVLGWPRERVQLAALWVPIRVAARFPGDFPGLSAGAAGYQRQTLGRREYLRIGPQIWLGNAAMRTVFLERARGADRRANQTNMVRLLF